MSYTLIMHGIDPKTVGTACATCDNAVWRAIKGVENSDFTEFFPLNYRENDTKIGCWCTVFHCYIQTMTEDTLKSYQTDIAPHSHTYRFNLAGQVPTLGTGETIYVPAQDMTDSITEHGGVALQRTQVIQSQAQNRTVTGQLHDSDTLHGVYTGGTETAPTHTYVRYFIRAVP